MKFCHQNAPNGIWAGNELTTHLMSHQKPPKTTDNPPLTHSWV